MSKMFEKENGTYTGVGSRSTPKDVLYLMSRISLYFSERGFVLRSGGADGADQAFECSADKKEIYRPTPKSYERWPAARKIAKQHHPVFDNLSPIARKYIVRNTFQVLGQELTDPSDFLVCWTSDGATSDEERTRTTGGTGQTISVADTFNVPVYNLNKKGHRELFEELIQ